MSSPSISVSEMDKKEKFINEFSTNIDVLFYLLAEC